VLLIESARLVRPIVAATVKFEDIENHLLSTAAFTNFIKIGILVFSSGICEQEDLCSFIDNIEGVKETPAWLSR